MTRRPRIAAILLLGVFALALMSPVAAVAAGLVPGPRGLATCKAGFEMSRQTYYKRVVVHDARGHRHRAWRRHHRWTCIEDVRPPTRVKNLTAVPGDGRVVVTWTPAEDAGGVAGYEVYRDGTYLATINDRIFTDTAAVNGIAHQYRVYTVDMARNMSRASGVVWALPKALPDVQAPGVPIGLSAAADPVALTVTLRWTAPTDDKGVTGYRIYRAGALLGTSVAPTYTDADLSHKSEYKYSVVALDAAGNISAETPAVSTYVS